MAAGAIASDNYLFDIHPKLRLSLSNYPNVSLKAVIYWVRIRITWCKSIVYAENRNVNLISPKASVRLMRCRVLTHKSATVKMNYNFFDLLRGRLCYIS